MKVVAATMRAIARVLSDPGSKPPTLTTGVVVIASTQRPDRFEALRASLEGSLAAERYVVVGAEAVPANRARRLNAFVEERWSAVNATLPEDATLAEVLTFAQNGVIPVIGWRVTQHVAMRRSFADMTSEEIRQHVLSLQQAPDDAYLNGYYPTIAGNDVAHYRSGATGMDAHRGGAVVKGQPTFDANGRMTHDGTVRGGTEVRGGRSAYREATKGYEAFGPGWFRDVDKIKADKAAKRNRQTELEIAKRDALLPRSIGEL
jgi:hypothetical protein